MLFDFFFRVREAGVPASVKEFLTLLEALDKGVVYGNVDDFYVLSRACLVKDEAYFDRFDLAFGAYFKGVQAIPDALVTDIPASWLEKLAEKWLTPEEKARIESMGGWDKLMEALRERSRARSWTTERYFESLGTARRRRTEASGFTP